jgi:hypothetical protein
VIKHVDVIAIALLLGGAALYSQARNLSLIRVVPTQRSAIAQTIQRAMRCSHTVRVQRAASAAQTSAASAHAGVVIASE